MTTNDPIADFLTRIRNGQMAGLDVIRVPYSKVKHEIAKVMHKYKFLKEITVEKSQKNEKFNELVITLPESRKLTLKRVSRCGQRIYGQAADLFPVNNGLGISIISTSKGLLAGVEAKKAGIGGEVLCEVY